MEHDDPDTRRVKPGRTEFVTWRFTKAGMLEYRRLISGHRAGGMIGAVAVN